jgi:hypothetical protein
MLSSEQQLAYSLLCCIDQTVDSSLTIFIHHAYDFNHFITIMTQKNLLYVGVSKISQNSSTDRQQIALRECVRCA